MDRAEPNTNVAGAPSVPMSGIWRTIRDYVLWSYERGTIQYDVMVTLILVFIFFSPFWVNFNDKPMEHTPHPTGVVVVTDESGGLIYQIDGSTVTGKDETTVRGQLLRIIVPISGAVSITKYEVAHDRSGQATAYKVWVKRE